MRLSSVCLHEKLFASSPPPPVIFHMDNNVPRKVSPGITEMAIGVGLIYMMYLQVTFVESEI